MANFFKNYQMQVRERRAAELQARRESERAAWLEEEFFDNLEKGARVKVNPAYSETGYLYFAAKIDNNYILLNKNKREAAHGYGLIYSRDVVIIKT